jgi:hypothetical protein
MQAMLVDLGLARLGHARCSPVWGTFVKPPPLPQPEDAEVMMVSYQGIL